MDTYETKTGLDRDKLAKMMTDETWLTARKAKDLGFIDEVVTGSGKKPGVMDLSAGFVNCLTSYKHVPEDLMKNLVQPLQQSTAQSEPSEEERRLRDLVKLLK